MAMVNVSGKPMVFREATATGIIRLKADTIQRIKKNTIAKGDPLYAAKLAGILAAKRTSVLIPLCHLIPLTNVEIDTRVSNSEVVVTATVRATAQTGVEMEALTATSVALLTVWDMVKQYEKDSKGQYPSTKIENVHVITKTKGSTGEKSRQ